MFKTQASYLQHRNAIGTHSHWKDQSQPTQKQHNTLIKKLASRPGLHNGNVQQQSIAYTLIQLIAILTSVRNCDTPRLNTQHERRWEENQLANFSVMPIKIENTIEKTKIGSNVVTSWSPIHHIVEHTGRLFSEYDPLYFPAAAATELQPPPSEHAQTLFTTPSKSICNELLKNITGIDCSKKAIHGHQLLPTIFFFKHNVTQRRSKRISEDVSQKQQNEIYQRYLKDNCHIRTKTNNGTVLGDYLLVSGETVRNPFRTITEALYKNINNKTSMEPWRVNMIEGLNTGIDIILGIFTIGVYPIIKYGSAKALSLIGHAINDDMTCLQNEFTPEEMAKLLFDTEIGITHRKLLSLNSPSIQSVQSPKFISDKPIELKNINKFQPDGVFVHENTNSKVNTVKYMQVAHGGKKFHIKETKPGEHYLFEMKDTHSSKLKKRVYFDEKNNKIHLNKVHTDQGLEYDIVDGNHFIEIRGEPYVLRYNLETQSPEVVLTKSNGETYFVQVYREPFSKTWHLSTHNNNHVFGPVQRRIIQKISITPNKQQTYVALPNENQRDYGTGKIYWAKIGDHSYAANDRYIEINGKSVPVRKMRRSPKQPIRYEVYDKNQPNRNGYLVAWDGHRWVFEKLGFNKIPKKLTQLISPPMYEKNINPNLLSLPDSHGIQWNKFSKGFLQIGDHYIKIKPMGENRFLIQATSHNHKIYLRFKKNKFFVETYQERLQCLFKIPCYKKPMDSIKALKMQNNFSKANTHHLLSQYDFPKKGIFNKYSFSLEAQQTGTIPIWAKRFKKNILHRVAKTRKIVSVINPANSEQQIILNLGKRLGHGNFGDVFLDADNTNYVIKRYKPRNDNYPIHAQIKKEAENFQYYYGAQSTQIFHDANKIYYLRMYKIPGVLLDELPKNSLPKDAIERYVDMLEKLNGVGIIHGDLHTNNILWDADSNTFFPIDMGNIKQLYFQPKSNNKEHFNIINEKQWNAVIMKIKEKIVK